VSDVASPTTASGPGALAKRIARGATAPVRGYLNDHFEMVKEEVRRVGATAPAPATPVTGTTDEAWARVAELENLMAEQAVHQARVLARNADELAALSARVEELEALVRTMVELLAPPAADAAS
jgi:hypothetical protein